MKTSEFSGCSYDRLGHQRLCLQFVERTQRSRREKEEEEEEVGGEMIVVSEVEAREY